MERTPVLGLEERTPLLGLEVGGDRSLSEYELEELSSDPLF